MDISQYNVLATYTVSTFIVPRRKCFYERKENAGDSDDDDNDDAARLLDRRKKTERERVSKQHHKIGCPWPGDLLFWRNSKGDSLRRLELFAMYTCWATFYTNMKYVHMYKYSIEIHSFNLNLLLSIKMGR